MQQFEWYKNDVLVTTNQSNTFSPTGSGKYYCKIKHNTLTVSTNVDKNLILQSEDYIINVLPVELLNFTAHPHSKTIHLNWQTASERNASHFDVESSLDGKTFKKIGQVKTKGNSNTLQTYSFVDETPFSGLNYYRLRQIDVDGTETLSNTVSVMRENTTKLRTYPNPVSTLLNIDTSISGNYQIVNLLGQEVKHGTISSQIDVSTLPEGTYFLKIGTEQARFVKQ